MLVLIYIELLSVASYSQVIPFSFTYSFITLHILVLHIFSIFSTHIIALFHFITHISYIYMLVLIYMHYSDAFIFPSHTTLICMYIPYSLSFITSHIHLLLHFLRSYPYSYVMHIPYALSNNISYFLTVMYIHISHSFLLYAISIYSLE